MRKTRMFAAAVSLAALLGATAAAGGTATAQTNGVGTTKATTTAVNVALGSNGSLLNVRVLGDDGSANIDPKQGTPSAASSSISGFSMALIAMTKSVLGRGPPGPPSGGGGAFTKGGKPKLLSQLYAETHAGEEYVIRSEAVFGAMATLSIGS